MRVAVATVGMSMAVGGVAVAAMGGASGVVLMLCLGVLYLGIGCFTAASYALFMDLTDPRLGATQFGTFMAATNACEAWAVWTAGKLVSRFDYGPALLVMAVVGLLGLAFLRPLKPSAE